MPFEAGTSEVDDFEIQIIDGFEKDIFRLEVAVNQLRLFDDLHRLENLIDDEATKVQGDPLEGVLLQQVIDRVG